MRFNVAMNEIAIVCSCVVGLLAAKVLYHLLFDDGDDFCGCLGATLTPDILSLFNGELFKNMAESFRMGFFLWISFGAGFLVYWALTEIIEML